MDKKEYYLENQLIIDSDKIIITGAGNFQEENLYLNQEQALLLYLKLHQYVKQLVLKSRMW